MCKMGATKKMYQQTYEEWDLEDEEYFYEQYKKQQNENREINI